MLNQDRIRTMIKLNRCEEGKNKDFIQLNGTYRSDYIGMALLRNFFCITIGYLLLLGVGGLYHFEFLAANWFKIDLAAVIVRIFMIYAALLIGYSVFVYIVYSVKYSRMKIFIKAYDKELRSLEDLYVDDMSDAADDIDIEDSYLDDWEDEE